MKIIDGTAMAEGILGKCAEAVAGLKLAGVTPGLAVVLVGHDPASDIYVRRKIAKCRQVGIRALEHRLPAATTTAELLKLIASLNENGEVDGILVQLPLPRQIDEQAVLDAIIPSKDVDGFHPVNVGRLSTGGKALVPCTPLGCMHLLSSVIDDFRGLKAVVIGKSNIVGKPVAMLLLDRECTVTITHIHTRNLPELARTADILVSAAGSPGLVRPDWVKPGAVLIDVGINEIFANGRRKIVGDAELDGLTHAKAVTPVPGGVGPMTIACLIENTVRAAATRVRT